MRHILNFVAAILLVTICFFCAFFFQVLFLCGDGANMAKDVRKMVLPLIFRIYLLMLFLIYYRIHCFIILGLDRLTNTNTHHVTWS